MGSGFSHVGLSTLDMDATIQFYKNVLGFPLVAEHKTRIKEGGMLRQAYFEVGDQQFIVFMEPKEISGIPAEYDTGINGALGLPGGMYHFALKIHTLDGLEKMRNKLEDQGIDVSQVIDLGHAKSIFLLDPNNLQIEFCCDIRTFTDSDLHQQSEASIVLPDQDDD
ncbi:VOC family protein [Methylomarinum sp. Ch1-1]|uniref:VOC family protein n=1 Tax=Methylomarinum roseum TaxID=3067653 RepID=A0AAU7NRV6_9GAMM|nr:VOC family protein [Methylomarinum sp. Ch1-1]MDP4520291.1 VOC family protein [Methylomarinum sp. Ch1-1]